MMIPLMTKPEHLKIGRHMGVLDWFFLVGLAFSWGASFSLNEVLLRELPPFSIVWARQVTALALFVPLALPFVRQTPWSKALLWRLVVMSMVAIAMPFSLFVIGQQYITSVLAGIGNGAVPLFTLLIAALWMADERLGRAGVLGLVVGFSGIMLLFLPMVEARDFTSIWGFGATVLASIMYGFANVFARTIPTMPILMKAMIINFVAVIALSPMMLLEQPDYAALSAQGWVAVLTIGFFGNFVAYILYFNMIRRVGSVNTSQVAYLIPFAALFLGLFALGEEVSIHALGALALVLAGLWIKDRAQKSALKQSPKHDA